MKKALKIIGVIFLLLLIFVIAAPFLFKGAIEKQIKKAINENLNAQVEWTDLSLSLIKSFPDARLNLKNLSVINKEPFAGDTLVFTENLFLNLPIPQLFKSSEETLSIKELTFNKALVNVKFNEEGVGNYDITQGSSTQSDADDKPLSLDINYYEIRNSTINYLDESRNIYLILSDLNHEGRGDFSEDIFTLATTTKALVSFTFDDLKYLNENKVSLDADIEMDLKNMKFTFKDNKGLVNQLPLTFEGYVKMNEDNQEMDLSFRTPDSDFKNFLGVIPEAYLKNLESVKTTGDFNVNGRIYGIKDETHIPKLDIALKSDNASFKFPDLPKAVEQISFEAVLKNETGLMKDMGLDLKKLRFRIDQDAFDANGTFKNLLENMLVNLHVDGTLNLANIDKAYPIQIGMDLNGVLKADMSTNFAMNDIDQKRYEKINSSGTASLKNFKYTSDDFPNPLEISKAGLTFYPGNVNLNEFELQTGQTDIHLKGSIQNLMGYLFKNQPVKGNFNMTSSSFALGDFMMKTETKKEENPQAKAQPEEAVRIPSFLDIVLNVTADKVLYDNLLLKDVHGSLILKDEKATLKDISTSIFGGNIGLNGSVSTKEETPEFDLALSLNKLDIGQSMEGLALFQKAAPIIKSFVGSLSTSINLKGDLTKDLSLIYSSLTGDGMAQLLNTKVEKDKLPWASKLDGKLDFLNLKDIDLKDWKTQFAIEDGGITVNPFQFNIHKDINANLSGHHGFDNQADYTLNLDLPAKYLGKDITAHLANLSGFDMDSYMVNIPILFTGQVKSPHVSIDIQTAAETLAKQIVEHQKDKLADDAKGKLADFLSGNKDKDKDSDTNDTIQKSGEDKLKEALDEKKDKLEEKVEEAKDKAKEKVEEELKSAFENIFGKKGKSDDKDKK